MGKNTHPFISLLEPPGDAWHHDGAREIEGTSTSTEPWQWLMMASVICDDPFFFGGSSL